MSPSPVPLIVVTTAEDEVELINKTLRDAGHPAHCHWVKRLDVLQDSIRSIRPELLVYYAERFQTPVVEIAKLRQQPDGAVPLLVMRPHADETAIAEVLAAGAQDLVSIGCRERLAAVATRELRAFRLERSLNRTLLSATQYKHQFKTFLAGAVDAIAYVQEGIVVEANQAWAELFGRGIDDAVHTPLMDFFDAGSHAALKGAIVACAKGQWSGEALSVVGTHGDGSSSELSLLFEQTAYDGEPAIKLSVPRETADGAAPEELVEATVHKDPMTGLFHRRRFIEVLSKRLETSPRGGVRALAYIRPDKFGEIEEEIGPLASEELLVGIAEIL